MTTTPALGIRGPQFRGQSVRSDLVRRSLFWMVLISAAVSPNVAFANMGTGLMVATWMHMFCGNLLIGLVEGLLLSLIFKARIGVCLVIMIAANYCSAWVGVILMGTAASSLDIDLYNVWRLIRILVFVTYLLLLVLEWPFVAWCLRRKQGWFWKSIYGSLIVQTVTYIGLFAWYWGASGKTLITDLAIVPPSEIRLRDSLTLYYLSQGDAYSLNLGSRKTQKVATIDAGEKDDRLLFRKGDAPSTWDLVARLEAANPDQPTVCALLRSIPGEAAPSEGDTKDPPTATWNNCGEVPRLGPDEKAEWTFACEFWGSMFATPRGGNERYYAVELPFVRWPIRNATQLPDDKVIFQLGRQQVCVLDPDRRQVAVLAKGHGPAVLLARPSDTEADQDARQ